MARLVQSQISSLLIGIFVVMSGCNAPETPVHTVFYKMLNRDSATQLQMVNGLLMKNNQPFTGTLYALYPATTDTAELASYKEGKEHGEWKFFYPGHQPKEIRYFKDGQKEGKIIAWWPNGTKQLEYFFVKSEYEGTCREWSDIGFLNKQMNYKNGHEEGLQQWWYDNGKIKANYIIKDGRRYGLLGTKNCVNVSDSIFKK